jgi:hypothetical protein
MTRRNEMEMFDELISTTIKPDGTAEVKALPTGEILAEAEFAEACDEYVRAARKFEKLDRIAKAQKGIPDNLCAWFDALEEQFQADKRLWLLFVGVDRSRRSNLMYCEYRKMLLLSGEKLPANA